MDDEEFEQVFKNICMRDECEEIIVHPADLCDFLDKQGRVTG